MFDKGRIGQILQNCFPNSNFSQGYMFFTEWGTAPPKLERAQLDGTERTDIVNKNIVYPYGVAVDHPNRLAKLFT